MRTMLLAAALLLLWVPAASAADPVDARCDVDDDLYQHCNVAFVHVVYGPMCAGVNVKDQPAECVELVS